MNNQSLGDNFQLFCVKSQWNLCKQRQDNWQDKEKFTSFLVIFNVFTLISSYFAKILLIFPHVPLKFWTGKFRTARKVNGMIRIFWKNCRALSRTQDTRKYSSTRVLVLGSELKLLARVFTYVLSTECLMFTRGWDHQNCYQSNTCLIVTNLHFSNLIKWFLWLFVMFVLYVIIM